MEIREMRAVLPALVLLAAAPAHAQTVGAPERLRVLPSCDGSGVEACMDVAAWLDTPKEDAFFYDQSADSYVQATSIRGRLDGEPARDHAVLLNIDEACESAFLAYLGRDEDGAPLVLTDAGELAIEAPEIDLFNDPAYVLIDPATEKLLGAYAAPWRYSDFELFFHASAEVYVRHRGLCLTAPSERPGRIAVAPGKCVEDADADTYDTVELKN